MTNAPGDGVATLAERLTEWFRAREAHEWPTCVSNDQFHELVATLAASEQALRERVGELERLVGDTWDPIAADALLTDVSTLRTRLAAAEQLLREAHEARIARESGSYGDLCERIDAALGTPTHSDGGEET